MDVRAWLERRRKVLGFAQDVKQRYGKGLWSQFREILALRSSRNKLGPEEYFEFRAYDDKMFSPSEKLQFVGWRQERTYGEILNDASWNVVTGDKLIAYAIFNGLGLPFPKIVALYHPFGRKFPGARSISEPNELAAYLREEVSFPFFSKPAHGASGRNSVACIGYCPEDDHLILANNDKVALAKFVEGCHPRKGVFPWESGFIFQEMVKPSETLQRIFGPMVCGLRAVVLNPDGAPLLHRVILKIPTGKSMTDNFGSIGETGTIIAEIDPQSGEIVRAQNGMAPNMNELQTHPTTGAILVGQKIPNWNDYIAVLDEAARAFPGLRLQHWDVAVSEVGPIIFEMNDFGGFGLPQIAVRKGFVDEDFYKFTAALGKKYDRYRAIEDI